MLRVHSSEARSRTIVIVDGQLSGDQLEVVETCCDQAISAGKPVDLFLRDITAIDKAGRTLLGRILAKGVHLFGRGVYTSHVVQELTSQGLKAPGPAKAHQASAPAGNRT